jgi:hypothetical protein
MTLFTILRSNLYSNLTTSLTLTATLALSLATNQVQAQRFDTIPDLERIWDGGFSVRPVNGVDMPWNKTNLPKLNARAKAYQEVWEETVAPKYDCQPASSPAIQYDPYHMQITQWPDRVLMRYEKDDQLRTVWLDGREPSAVDFSLQGFSVGVYKDDALIVTTTHFVFDIAGFDDYNGIPSSAQKILTEKYWIEGEQLNMTLTLEDPMFLLEPASYTTRWLPAAKGYKLDVYDCDAEASRASVRFFPSKYDD